MEGHGRLRKVKEGHGFGTWIWDWTWAKQFISFVSDFVSFIFYRTLIIMSITLALGIVKVSQILTH